MKIKDFLPKKRTIIACLLIIVLLVSTSIGLGYAKYTHVTDPTGLSYQVKNYNFPATNYVVVPKDSAATGSYSIVSPDGNARISIPKTVSTDGYARAEYLVAYFNPQTVSIDYTKNTRQIDYRYELNVTAIDHSHPLTFYGLPSDKAISVYFKLGTDADYNTITNSVRYASPISGYTSLSFAKSEANGQVAFGRIGALYSYSTGNELLHSRFQLDYDKKNWAFYADTTWYDTTSNEFNISTAAQLAGLAKLVNNGTDTFEGKTIKLSANISLADSAGYLRRWTPIGTYAHPFKGNFDGHNKAITGLNVPDFGASGDNAAAGLFGYVKGSASTSIKNFTLDTAYLAAELWVDASVTPASDRVSSGAIGAVAGWAEGYNFENITVKNADVCGIAKCGGIIAGRCNTVTMFRNCDISDNNTTDNGGFTRTDTEQCGYVDNTTGSRSSASTSSQSTPAPTTAVPDAPATSDEH